MSLVPDYDNTSSESECSNQSEESSFSSTASSAEHEESFKPTEKFPTPGFLGEQATSLATQNSVFSNPFKEAENAKQAILEKHVKMVNTYDSVTTINGKRICWNFRKGKCRFGHNCIYAHDSDVQKTKEQLEEKHQQTQVNHSQLKNASFKGNKEEPHNSLKRKKRPGLTQGIQPGKKVMKAYHEQKPKCIL